MSFQNCHVKGSGIDSQAYHAEKGRRGTKDFRMSPSSLKLFARCPARWVAGYSLPDSGAKRWGSIIDARLLTPEQFEQRYVLTPTHYTRDGERKAWRNDLRIPEVAKWVEENKGKEFLTKAELDECDAAIKRLLSDETILSFHTASDKQVLVVGEWRDEDTGLVVPVECLLDYVPRLGTEFAKCLGDLKTTTNAALSPFQRWCYTAEYHIQASFDTDLYVTATNEDRCSWCFIVQENFAPWQTGKRLLSQNFLELGRSSYKKLLALYCRCLATGKWPGYDDTDEAVQGWSLVEPDPWMESAGMFAPKFETPDDAPPEAETEDVIP